MRTDSPRSLRRAYLDWVEARIEEYKESMPRAELLALADRVIAELQVAPDGQYQLTEILLCHAVDRRLFRMLKLPGYRAWLALEEARSLPPVLTLPFPDRIRSTVTDPPADPGLSRPETATERRDRLARVG
jgi:hypothetical protein